MLILPAAILIACSWLFLLTVFTGIGLLFQKLCRPGSNADRGYPESFWTGFACSVFILQMWHLGARVNLAVFLILALLGSAGIFWNIKRIWYDFKNCFLNYKLPLIILVFISLWLGNRAILPPLIYDSGLYHLSAVRWITDYPIVPGLGNLHGRLAFNCSYFLFPAMLEASAWPQKSHHIANGLLLLALYMQMISSIFTVFRNPEKGRMQHLFYALLFGPVFLMTLSSNSPSAVDKLSSLFIISSPSPDLPVMILGFVLFGQMLALLDNRGADTSNINYSLIIIFLLAMLGVTIKLTFLVLAVFIVILSLFYTHENKAFKERANIINLSVYITACLVLCLLPWLIRGILLSGYPAYPASFGRFPVKWAIPEDNVFSMKRLIYSWARMPGIPSEQVLGNWNWIRIWSVDILKNISDVIIPVGLFTFSTIALFFFKAAGKIDSSFKWNRILILVPPAASLIFWFFSAPAIRFVGASFLLLGIGATTLVFCHLKFLRKHIKICLSIFLILIVSQNLFNPLEKNFVRILIKERNFEKAFSGWTVPGLGLYDTPIADIKEKKTKSGLVVYVPASGDRCWDAPLPCTPDFNENLALIEEGRMENGFMIQP